MTVQVIIGDCRDQLKKMAGESVHCVVTSPPYFGLRDYGTATWLGGDPGCDHLAPLPGGTRSSGLGAWDSQSQDAIEAKVAKRQQQYRDICGKCSARREDKQIGLEATPDAYVAALVGVFRNVRRVLRNEGTLWLNLGDSYASGGRATYQTDTSNRRQPAQDGMARPPDPPGIKPKDILGIPWRVAFALQADGWYLRQDIIWAKPNPMPESVVDRCTRSHEYLFLLTRSPRYFYDAEAIAEPVAPSTVSRLAEDVEAQGGSKRANGGTRPDRPMKAVGGNETRNARSVWTISTQPFAEAHFATFPPELAERCIMAGCPPYGRVLDPFAGAGTTGLVADRLQRDAILIELNPAYAEIARRRIDGDAGLLFQQVEIAHG